MSTTTGVALADTLEALAQPMARLLLEVPPKAESGFCRGCGANAPEHSHVEACAWGPGGLIEQIRKLLPAGEET